MSNSHFQLTNDDCIVLFLPEPKFLELFFQPRIHTAHLEVGRLEVQRVKSTTLQIASDELMVANHDEWSR